MVVHPGALGDVLQSVPALRALRRHGPLTFSGQPRLGRLLMAAGVVETVLPFDGVGLEALFSSDEPPPSLVTRLARFDRIVSWFGAQDAVYVEQLRAISPHSVIASPLPEDNRSVWRYLLSTIGADSFADLAPITLPRSDRDEARRILDELGHSKGGSAPLSNIPPKAGCAGEARARTWNTNRSASGSAGCVFSDTLLGAEETRPLLVVHPGAGGKWKRWPADRLARAIAIIVDRTGSRILVHQGPADRDAVEEVCPLLDSPLLLVEPQLPLLAAVLGRASGYLGMDSGVSHLAAAVGAPSVILFPAINRERWTPWSPTAQALTITDEAGHVDEVAARVIALMRGSTR